MSMCMYVTFFPDSNFSALELDRDLRFSRGPPPGTPRQSRVVVVVVAAAVVVAVVVVAFLSFGT